jgi:hypothetical protein
LDSLAGLEHDRGLNAAAVVVEIQQDNIHRDPAGANHLTVEAYRPACTSPERVLDWLIWDGLVCGVIAAGAKSHPGNLHHLAAI